MTEALPLLLDLDGQPVAERWTSDEEDQASSNEDEEFPELRGPFCSERGDPAFQGSQPPQSTPLPALWDLGEAKTAVVSGDVVPGPDQSGHAGDSSSPPHLRLLLIRDGRGESVPAKPGAPSTTHCPGPSQASSRSWSRRRAGTGNTGSRQPCWSTY